MHPHFALRALYHIFLPIFFTQFTKPSFHFSSAFSFFFSFFCILVLAVCSLLRFFFACSGFSGYDFLSSFIQFFFEIVFVCSYQSDLSLHTVVRNRHIGQIGH